MTMPEPQPLSVVFSADLAALPAGRAFTLQAFTGARQVYVDLGTGDGPQETAGQLWEYTRPGNYRLTMIDADDLDRRVEIPVTVTGGEPKLRLTTARTVNTAQQFIDLGAYPDNHLGICSAPTGGTYFYFSGYNSETGHLDIVRTLGNAGDMLAGGEVVRTAILNNPFPPFPQAFFNAGPVHVVKRHGRPDLVLMASLLAESATGDANNVCGSVHLFVSGDYASFAHVGEIWRHGVDKMAFLSGALDPANYAGMNGGSSLLWVADGTGVENQGWLYFPLSQCNGPTHGPGGTADNFVPMSLARIWLPDLLQLLDAGQSFTHLVEKWHNGWNSRFDGPASPLPGASSLLGRFAPQIVWCRDLGLYLAAGQSAGTSDGNAVWMQSAPDPEGPWSPPQYVGRFGLGPKEAAPCPTLITPDGTVGGTFEVWAEVYDSAVNGPVRWDGMTVRVIK